MLQRLFVVGALGLALLTARPQGRAHPDFSGKWVLADSAASGVLGRSFTATRLVMALDASGQLIAEQMMIVDPPPWNVPDLQFPARPGKSTYKKNP